MSVIPLVEQFVDAFNARDEQRLLATLHEDIDFRLLHAVLSGKAGLLGLVRQQSDGVGYHLLPGRRFERNDELVMELRKELRWVETGEVGLVEDVAGVFVAKDGVLVRFKEFDSLTAALAESAVTEADEVLTRRGP